MPNSDPERAINSYIWSRYQPELCIVHILSNGTFDISIIHSPSEFGDGAGDYVLAKALDKTEMYKKVDEQRSRGAKVLTIAGLPL